MLLKYFNKYGSVRKAYVIKDHKTGKSKSNHFLNPSDFGFVEFETVADAETTVSVSEHILDGHKLTCTLFKQYEKKDEEGPKTKTEEQMAEQLNKMTQKVKKMEQYFTFLQGVQGADINFPHNMPYQMNMNQYTPPHPQPQFYPQNYQQQQQQQFPQNWQNPQYPHPHSQHQAQNYPYNQNPGRHHYPAQNYPNHSPAGYNSPPYYQNNFSSQNGGYQPQNGYPQYGQQSYGNCPPNGGHVPYGAQDYGSEFGRNGSGGQFENNPNLRNGYGFGN
jgi:hypothetical protein